MHSNSYGSTLHKTTYFLLKKNWSRGTIAVGVCPKRDFKSLYYFGTGAENLMNQSKFKATTGMMSSARKPMKVSPEIFQLIVKRLSIMYKNRLNELWLTENTTNLSGIVASFFLCTVHLSLQLVTSYLPLVYLLIELLLFLLEVGAVCLSLPTENKKKLVRKIFKDQDISVLITLNETVMV